MSTATMIRLNLAYVTLFVGFLLILIRPFKPFRVLLDRGLAYTGGVVTIIFLTLLPYLVNNLQQLWWSSVVVAS